VAALPGGHSVPQDQPES